jgi:4-diphosphocytidyl-2-C-methyl-D-erythritol kinase
MTISIFAPAKINLSLRVGQAGHDGRHPLDSLVAFAQGIGDRIEIEEARQLSLDIEGPFASGLTNSDHNLVLLAASILRAHLGEIRGARIKLIKHLPIASGIGGGSADAAATLVGLNRLWRGKISADTLQRLGAALGADVPACVAGVALRMTGTGEVIIRVPALPKLGIVLVNPLIACPTGPVYNRYDEGGAIAALRLDPLPDLSTPAALIEYLVASPNDLQEPATSLVPEIGDILRAIAQSPDVLLARMSGSGATYFGLYESLAMAQRAAVTIKNTLALSSVWVEADEIN